MNHGDQGIEPRGHQGLPFFDATGTDRGNNLVPGPPGPPEHQYEGFDDESSESTDDKLVEIPNPNAPIGSTQPANQYQPKYTGGPNQDVI